MLIFLDTNSRAREQLSRSLPRIQIERLTHPCRPGGGRARREHWRRPWRLGRFAASYPRDVAVRGKRLEAVDTGRPDRRVDDDTFYLR